MALKQRESRSARRSKKSLSLPSARVSLAESDILASAVAQARLVQKNSHSPYSGYKVGASLVGVSGRIFSGCNVENMSFGATICAERAALVQAIAAGERDFELLVVQTPERNPKPPCGMCLQMLSEFLKPTTKVILTGSGARIHNYRFKDLLPLAFQSAKL